MTRSPVLSFVPRGHTSVVSTEGSLLWPVTVLVIVGPVAALLGYWLRDAIPALDQDPIFVAPAIVGFVALALGAGLAALKVAAGLVGRRRLTTARLLVPGGFATAGQTLRAEVEGLPELGPDASAVCVLTCHASESYGDGYSSLFDWCFEQIIDGPGGPLARPGRIAVAIDVPSEAPPSGDYRLATAVRIVHWTLAVTIEPRRLADFRFAVAMTSRQPPTTMLDQPLPRADESSPERPAGSRIRVDAEPAGGTVYGFPRPRAFACWVAWVVMTAPLWVVLPWLASVRDRDWPGSLVAVLLIAALVNGVPFITLFHERRLRVGPEGIVIQRLGLPPRRTHVRDVRAVVTRPIQGPIDGGRHLRVAIERASGGSRHIFTCRSEAEARWLAGDITRAVSAEKARRDALAG